MFFVLFFTEVRRKSGSSVLTLLSKRKRDKASTSHEYSQLHFFIRSFVNIAEWVNHNRICLSANELSDFLVLESARAVFVFASMQTSSAS